MESMPNTSQVSLGKGAWFVFPLGSMTVRAWGSGISGLERIYVDNTLVSEQKNRFNRISVHNFAIDGEPYSVTFKTQGCFTFWLECSLAKDGVPVKTLLAKQERSSCSPKRLFLSIIAGVIIGIGANYFQLPLWITISLLAVVILVQRKTRKPNEILIEEVPYQQSIFTNNS